jgi:hypothetical protein
MAWCCFTSLSETKHSHGFVDQFHHCKITSLYCFEISLSFCLWTNHIYFVLFINILSILLISVFKMFEWTRIVFLKPLKNMTLIKFSMTSSLKIPRL